MIRILSGEKLDKLEMPRSKWQQELTVRALIDRNLVCPVGWHLTDLGLKELDRIRRNK